MEDAQLDGFVSVQDMLQTFYQMYGEDFVLHEFYAFDFVPSWKKLEIREKKEFGWIDDAIAKLQLAAIGDTQGIQLWNDLKEYKKKHGLD